MPARIRRKPPLKRLARHLQVWLGDDPVKKAIGVSVGAAPMIASFWLFGKYGPLATFGVGLLLAVFWFWGYRRNQIDDEASQLLRRFTEQWKGLRDVRRRAAKCADSRFGLMRFGNEFEVLDDGSPHPQSPHIVDEALQVIRFFEDLSKEEYKWKYASEEFHETLKVPMNAFCRSFWDVILAKVAETPDRTSELIRVLRKYFGSGRADEPGGCDVIFCLHRESDGP